MLGAAVCVAAQTNVPLRLNNIGGATQGMTVYAIVQDARGMMWLGTNEGLCSYDGYDVQRYGHAAPDARRAGCSRLGRINCMAAEGDSIVIGYERGMEVFRIGEGRYSPCRTLAGHNVRAVGGGWAGTDKALYLRGRRQGDIRNVFSVSHVGNSTYVGTASSLYACTAKGYLKMADMNYVSGVASIAALPGKLFVGTGPALATVDSRSGKVLDMLPMPVVKTLLADAGRLLMGTDNGLYIVTDGAVRKVLHDAFRPDNSLAGNVVWSLFRDRDDNIWIGTDNGVSMMQKHPAVCWYYLTDITGRHEGCLIEKILIDGHRRTWLGGSSGLICVENLGQPGETCRWYRMGDARYPLPHNHIRCIYEDGGGRILAGGDGGMVVYDERTRQFVRHRIEEDQYNWIYDIRGRGGRLVVVTSDKTYLLDGTTFSVLSRGPAPQGSDATAAGKPLGERNMVTLADVTWHKDARTGLLWTGGNDRFGFTSAQQIRQASRPRKVCVTRLEPWGQDGIAICFSDFDYNPEKQTLYSYRLTGLDDEWHTTAPGEHIIRYSHLSPGTYAFEIAPKGRMVLLTACQVVIPRPWFTSIPMLILYALLFVALVVAIIVFFIQRKTIRLEREQRQVMLLAAKRKERELQQELVLTATEKNRPAENPSIDDNFLSAVTHTIENRMEEPDLTPAAISEICHMPQKQLYRKLKQLTGMTTVEYIRHLRIEHAAYLLGHGSFTVAEVMYRVGFTNASYFSRAFVKLKGITPSEYKKSVAGGIS